MEQIKAMLEVMEKDTALGEKMTALIASGDVPKIITAAAEKGFVFTEADWQMYTDWSKTLSTKAKSKELSPEEMEQIVGGGEGKWPWDPRVGSCWFHDSGSEDEFRHGKERTRCNQFACNALSLYEPEAFVFCQCRCWGTDKCIDNWHSHV